MNWQIHSGELEAPRERTLTWDDVWTAFWVIIMGCLVHWITSIWIRLSWHRLHAEEMAHAVGDVVEQERLQGMLSDVERRVQFLQDQLRSPGEKCDGRRER